MSEVKNERKKWFLFVERIMRGFIKESKFIYLGEKITNGGIILSNHEGTAAPLAFELYSNLPIRFWGAYEMNSGLIKMYKYQSRVYYHEKKHWNLHLARLFCLIASPLTNMFYKGLNLISVYKDYRLKTTFTKSIESLQKGHNLVIFPENSEKGYLKELEGFHGGFVLLLKYCKRNNINAPVYVAYYKKEEKKYIIDKPLYVNDILQMNLSKEELTKMLCDRCNLLGKMELKEENAS